MYATHLRGNVTAIAVAARNTTLADWLFVATSGVVQPISGLLMVRMAGYGWFESWLVATYVLYGVAAVCWIRVVALQYRIRALQKSIPRRKPPSRRLLRSDAKVVHPCWPAFPGPRVLWAVWC